jgi:glucose-1-phosphate cytidylyltransferase
MTAVQPAGRFGALEINDDATVHSFVEKPNGDGNWINGGFFVCNPSVFDAIKNDATVFEKEPLESLANANELVAYKHQGFWQCMDTLRDKILLNDLWDSNTAPWKKW